MTEPRYSVGWNRLTPAELEKLPEHYREETQGIVLFGGVRPVLRDTPEEAQRLLKQILKVNTMRSLRELTGVGGEALYIVECRPRPEYANPWGYPICSRWVEPEPEAPEPEAPEPVAPAPEASAVASTWGVFETNDPKQRWQIQREDDNPVFPSDETALDHICSNPAEARRCIEELLSILNGCCRPA
jgi:hypothetical protein